MDLQAVVVADLLADLFAAAGRSHLSVAQRPSGFRFDASTSPTDRALGRSTQQPGSRRSPHDAPIGASPIGIGIAEVTVAARRQLPRLRLRPFAREPAISCFLVALLVSCPLTPPAYRCAPLYSRRRYATCLLGRLYSELNTRRIRSRCLLCDRLFRFDGEFQSKVAVDNRSRESIVVLSSSVRVPSRRIASRLGLSYTDELGRVQA